MNSVPSGCAGDGCVSGLHTWPLHHIRKNGVLLRLCSSCVLLSYREVYCCCCLCFLAPEPPAHFDDGDDLLAPPIPIATCRLCNEAVAHRYCLQSADSTFVCPACAAATEGRLFSYAPPCMTPLDMRASRIVLLAARVALILHQKEAAAARATAERLYKEAAAEKARAYRALAVAFGVDPVLPAANHNVPPLRRLGEPPEDMASESRVVNMGMEHRKNPAPESNVGNMGKVPPDNHLASEDSEVTVAIGLDLNVPLPHTIGDDGEAGASVDTAESAKPNSPPPLRTLQLFCPKSSNDDEI
ncbi:hypothetical protein GUJ93_ZPchr0001g33047 [Zizania palustris]|uniref:Uncharacterized protein n=1 Tax=Zizania palustris TaxID=103762 RepID=A0A8J5RZQ2_ZIZPA|nr:hypothetical protein GUJ93_ZPchr0001g33047 [Zizania palustris]